MNIYSLVSLIKNTEVIKYYEAYTYDDAIEEHHKNYRSTHISIMRIKPNHSIIIDHRAPHNKNLPQTTNDFKVRFKRNNINNNRLQPDKKRDLIIEATSFEDAMLSFVTYKMRISDIESIGCYDVDIQQISENISF